MNANCGNTKHCCIDLAKVNDTADQVDSEQCVSEPYSLSSKSQRVIERISSMIDPTEPLDVQHDVKLFWHEHNMNCVFRGLPFAVRPISVELDPTNDCSYRCPFCTYADARSRTAESAGNRFMGREAMSLILHRLASGGVRSVLVTGGGEPLENPDTPFAIELAGKLGLRTGLFTNGSLLTSNVAKRILAAAPQFIRVSANAVTPHVYARFHGLRDERWATTTWDNIRAVAKLVCGHSTGFGLGVVVNRINVDDLTPLFMRALEVVESGGRIDYVAVRPVVNYTGSRQISTEVVARTKEACSIGQQMVKGSSLRIYVAEEYFDKVGVAGQCNLPPTTSTHCVGHPWMASVGYTGDVYLCSEGKYIDGNRIGNLLTQTLDEIWNSELRYLALRGSCQRPPVCKARRLTTRIEQLLEFGPLSEGEISSVNDFLSELRRNGCPGDVDFL